MEETRPRARPLSTLAIAPTAVLAGAIIGGTTNAVNGRVSPLYFEKVMRWEGVEDLWRAAIAQGIFEGLLYGIFFALVFTLVVGIASRAQCPYRFALLHLLLMAAAVYLCWAAGGLIAMGLALLSPEFYRRTFMGVPEEQGAMLRYAWVGGSIWGAMFGSLLTVVVGSILFPFRWRRRVSR